MQIYPAGTEVKTRIGDVAGMITATEIRYNHIRYEITYFNPADNTFISSWHHESELEVSKKVEKKQIGFK
jgi:hypothetical protein